MPKKSTSFYLSDESKNQLKEIADRNKRSQANMLEILIEDAYRGLGPKLSPSTKSPKKPK